jgi:hypothetical protein
MKKTVVVLLLFAATVIGVGDAAAGEYRLGAGVNYWVAMDDIDIEGRNIDENGIGYFVSYQYWENILGVEMDLEFLPDRFGDSAVAPQAFMLIGKSIYGGLGIGAVYTDGEFADKAFYALRAGFNFELLPGIYTDIYGIYRFNDTAELDNVSEDIDTDTVFLGAAVRFSF